MEKTLTTAFSHDYCAVAPGAADGKLKKGAGYWPCRVEVADGHVTLSVETAGVIDAAPVTSVQIVTPKWVRRVGAGTVIKLNGRLWVVDFGRVYQHEHNQTNGPGRLQTVFRPSTLAKCIRRARELNRDFTTALLTAGAADFG
ncbi:MAG: hypothetical protein JO345_20085 [Streptosporangiaceae bacterium]|nr:hypothetical protein [Streptosporangiaceae bacterium]